MLGFLLISCKKTSSNQQTNSAPAPAAPATTSLTAAGASTILIGSWIWDSTIIVANGKNVEKYTPTKPCGNSTLYLSNLESFTMTISNKPFQGLGNGSGIGSSTLANVGYYPTDLNNRAEVQFNVNYQPIYFASSTPQTNQNYNTIGSWLVYPNYSNTFNLLLFAGYYEPNNLTNTPNRIIESNNYVKIINLSNNQLSFTNDLNSTILNGNIHYFHK